MGGLDAAFCMILHTFIRLCAVLDVTVGGHLRMKSDIEFWCCFVLLVTFYKNLKVRNCFWGYILATYKTILRLTLTPSHSPNSFILTSKNLQKTSKNHKLQPTWKLTILHQLPFIFYKLIPFPFPNIQKNSKTSIRHDEKHEKFEK